jgi:hypothetical protein
MQLRLSVMSAVKAEVRPKEKEEAMEGQTGLSYE